MIAEVVDCLSALVVGQPVCGLLADGGYAERVAVPARQVMSVPLAPDGRLVIIGTQGGVKADLNIATPIGKRLAVLGTAPRGRPVHGPHGKGAIVEAVVDSV